MRWGGDVGVRGEPFAEGLVSNRPRDTCDLIICPIYCEYTHLAAYDVKTIGIK